LTVMQTETIPQLDAADPEQKVKNMHRKIALPLSSQISF
jgi:hypothetical protein